MGEFFLPRFTKKSNRFLIMERELKGGLRIMYLGKNIDYEENLDLLRETRTKMAW